MFVALAKVRTYFMYNKKLTVVCFQIVKKNYEFNINISCPTINRPFLKRRKEKIKLNKIRPYELY